MNAIILSALFGVVMMFAGVFAKNMSTYRHLATGGFILLLLANLLEYQGTVFFKVPTKNLLDITSTTLLFNIIICACGVIYLMLSGRDVEATGKSRSDYFALLFFIFCGIHVVTCYQSLMMLFLGIEIISIPLYILAASDKRNLKSNEAGLKYFLMGAFSTGIMLLGIAFLYGSMGSLNVAVMDPVLRKISDTAIIPKPWMILGMVMIMASMAFKVSAAPFHFWTPDVYDGSPTVFTSFMSTIVKAAVFIAFIRLFHGLFGTVQIWWKPLAAVITALTLLVGNITAVFQQSVKRMLAYSSIAQAGFMMFAVMVVSDKSYQGILLYTAAYCLATTGIFAVLMRMGDYTLDGFNGLAKKQPLLAAVTTIFLLSLSGIPLTAGFFAKYYMISAAVEGGVYMWLIVLAMICAAISIYYYFKVIQSMYFKDGDPECGEVTPGLRGTLVVTAALVILLGVLPNLITAWV
jgi:NADH-quinone oxidoreductase subunit N